MESLESVRALVEAGRPTAWSLGYPPAVRDRVAAYVRARRATGELPSRIAAELGLSRHSVVAWAKAAQTEAPPTRLVPVVVDLPAAASPGLPTPPAAPGLTLVSPRGFRVEGLTVDAAAALLGRLG
jgi:transposase